MSVRASVVLPAPRSPERVTRSPGSTVLAMSIASRRVACSSGSATEKLDVSDLVSAMASLAARSREHCHRGSRSALLSCLCQREYDSERGDQHDSRIERHGAGIDAGEVKDIVDDGEQRVGRDRDVAQIFSLLAGEWTGDGIAEKIRETDDVGERRAQFVRDVVNEIGLELVRRLQGFVALA